MFSWPDPDELRFRMAVLPPQSEANLASSIAALPSDSCIGVSRDGSDPLASCMAGGAQRRRRFAMSFNTKHVEDAAKKKSVVAHPVLNAVHEAYAVIDELLAVITDTDGACCQGDVDDDLDKIRAAFDMADQIIIACRNPHDDAAAASFEDDSSDEEFWKLFDWDASDENSNSVDPGPIAPDDDYLFEPEVQVVPRLAEDEECYAPRCEVL